jgi:hypothetical protein
MSGRLPPFPPGLRCPYARCRDRHGGGSAGEAGRVARPAGSAGRSFMAAAGHGGPARSQRQRELYRHDEHRTRRTYVAGCGRTHAQEALRTKRLQPAHVAGAARRHRQERAVADPEELRVLSAPHFPPVGAREYRVLTPLGRRRIRTNARLLVLPRPAEPVSATRRAATARSCWDISGRATPGTHDDENVHRAGLVHKVPML